MGYPRLETDIGRAGDATCEAQDVILPRERSMQSLKFGYIRDGLAGTAGRILELGCGDGKHSRSLERLAGGVRLCGCDIDVPTLEKARDASDRALYVGADVTNLPLKAELFDAVIFTDLLEHVPDYRAVIAEVRRVLKRDGKLICYIPLEGEAHSLFQIYFNLTGVNIMRPIGHVNMFRRDEVLDLLSSWFGDLKMRYSYHLFGQISNFAFFCYLYYRGKNYEFFRDESGRYRSSGREQRDFKEAVLRKLVRICNRIAYYESSILKNIRFPAVGLHVFCRKKTPIRPS